MGDKLASAAVQAAAPAMPNLPVPGILGDKSLGEGGGIFWL